MLPGTDTCRLVPVVHTRRRLSRSSARAERQPSAQRARPAPEQGWRATFCLGRLLPMRDVPSAHRRASGTRALGRGRLCNARSARHGNHRHQPAPSIVIRRTVLRCWRYCRVLFSSSAAARRGGCCESTCPCRACRRPTPTPAGQRGADAERYMAGSVCLSARQDTSAALM
jgi:hypothetical protein